MAYECLKRDAEKRKRKKAFKAAASCMYKIECFHFAVAEQKEKVFCDFKCHKKDENWML